jgi:hypothetical protein
LSLSNFEIAGLLDLAGTIVPPHAAIGFGYFVGISGGIACN